MVLFLGGGGGGGVSRGARTPSKDRLLATSRSSFPPRDPDQATLVLFPTWKQNPKSSKQWLEGLF